MTSVLYISYTGLMDPLGQSQVLQYVLALARVGHQMTVLSFEKPEALADTDRVAAVRKQCDVAGVDWRPLTWHSKPFGTMATIYDLIVGRAYGIRLAHEVDAKVVHCRSYIASLMGLFVKRATGTKLIFDMRGFWPDERVDGGIWKENSPVFHIFKRIERQLFLGADHVISLTRAGVREYENFEYMKMEAPKSTVIPTCTNLNIFQQKPVQREGFTIGYVGSVGSWYLFDLVAKVVARAFELRRDTRFLVVTKGSHDLVRRTMNNVGVDLDRVEISSASFQEVASQISRMDAGIFFYRPTWSKKATSPTRLGEFLACGKPCLANDGIGDVTEILNETGTGITLPVLGSEGVQLDNLDAALEKLFTLALDPETAAICRTVAEKRFNLRMGVEAYSRIYEKLSAESA